MQRTEVEMMFFKFLQMGLHLGTSKKSGQFSKKNEEPHNVKLSLAADGVNPFREIHSTYSVWPIFVINNNLCPWMSVKREHTMLGMIVPGI